MREAPGLILNHHNPEDCKQTLQLRVISHTRERPKARVGAVSLAVGAQCFGRIVLGIKTDRQ